MVPDWFPGKWFSTRPSITGGLGRVLSPRPGRRPLPYRIFSMPANGFSTAAAAAFPTRSAAAAKYIVVCFHHSTNKCRGSCWPQSKVVIWKNILWFNIFSNCPKPGGTYSGGVRIRSFTEKLCVSLNIKKMYIWTNNDSFNSRNLSHTLPKLKQEVFPFTLRHILHVCSAFVNSPPRNYNYKINPILSTCK